MFYFVWERAGSTFYFIQDMDDKSSLPKLKRRFDGFRQSTSYSFTDNQPVNNYFNVMPHISIEIYIVGQVVYLTIHSGARISSLQSSLEIVLIFTFLLARYGR